MNLESVISYRSPISNHPSGQQQENRDQSNQTLAGKVMASFFWDAHGILFINYLDKEKSINTVYYTPLLEYFEARIFYETATHAEAKNTVSSRQCCVLQVDQNNGKIVWIGIQIAFAPTVVFFRSGHQRLLALRRPEKNARWQMIWLKWRGNSATEAYFESKYNLFYKTGIEKLEKR